MKVKLARLRIVAVGQLLSKLNQACYEFTVTLQGGFNLRSVS